ncbi:hypothetical protein C8J57DRAFT_1465744 [Mycena rebaudengoi]|nr:hypothetical protein C8J57DRAFT_1465744 [Mycena rebaudengoi]
MKVSTAFFALIPLVAAVPSSNNVLLVLRAQLRGHLYRRSRHDRQCTSLPGAFTAQSFGPDAGLTCFVFDQVNCAGRSVGPITSGQVNPIPVGFEIASFRRTLIWFEGAPKQCATIFTLIFTAEYAVSKEGYPEHRLNNSGLHITLSEESHVHSLPDSSHPSTEEAPAGNLIPEKCKRKYLYELEGRDGVAEADVPEVGNARVADGAGLESGAAAITGGTQNEAVLVSIRPEAGDAVVEGRAEVDALAAAAVEGHATSREACVDANEANSEGGIHLWRRSKNGIGKKVDYQGRVILVSPSTTE